MFKPSAFMNPFFSSLSSVLPGGKTSDFGSQSTASTKVPGENLFALLLANMKPGAHNGGGNLAEPSVLTKNEPPVPSIRFTGRTHALSAAAMLESVFLNQGIVPDKLAVSREDLDFLGNVLESMGFARSRLETFFLEMKESRSDGFVTLARFLEDLSVFEQKELRKTDLFDPTLPDSMELEKSAIPHLELILRDLGFSPEKVNGLISAASRKNGAVDIEKLVFELKSQVHSKEKNPDTVQGLTDKKLKSPALEQVSVQRTVSGLEKLGVSIPGKSLQQPFTLDVLIQTLEKKMQRPVHVSRNFSMDKEQMTETLLGMPALKSIKMQKADTYFGYAREMMIEREKKPVENKTVQRVFESQSPKYRMRDVDSELIRMESFELETEKRLTAFKDGSARQENHQTLMPGGEKFQSTVSFFSRAAEGLSIPFRQMEAPPRGNLPSGVVEQVGKEIAGFLHRGERIFTLQLKPPELGMVTIEMDVKENVLKMSVVAETSSAKDMLQANYVELRRALEGYGVRVESFDVQLSSNLNNHTSANGDGTLNQQQHFHGRSGKNMHSGLQDRDAGDEDDIESPVMPQPGKEGLLDLLA